MRTKIRTSILNIPIDKWDKINSISKDGIINVSTHELISLIGISGGAFIVSKANDSEKEFIKYYYQDRDIFKESFFAQYWA